MARHYIQLCRDIDRGYPIGHGHEWTNEQRRLHILERKVEALVADLTALEAIVAEVVSDDASAAAQFAALKETVESLEAGQTIDQPTIDNLTSQLTSATTSLVRAATDAGAATAAAAPAADPAPAEAPADAAPAEDTTATAATADTPDVAPAAEDAPSA